MSGPSLRRRLMTAVSSGDHSTITVFAVSITFPWRGWRRFDFPGIRVDRFMEEAYDEAFEYDWTRTGEKTLETDVAARTRDNGLKIRGWFDSALGSTTDRSAHSRLGTAVGRNARRVHAAQAAGSSASAN